MVSVNQGFTSVKEFNLDRVKPNNNICLKRPTRLGYYSFHYNNENKSVFCPDKSALRYLDLPDPAPIDCLQGYDSNIKYGHKKPKCSNLLRWILENETILSNFTYDFICSNGLLKDLMISAYNNYDWNICAAKIRGKIVLSIIESIDQKEIIDAESEKTNKSSYATLKLQRLITKNNNKCTSGRDADSFYGVFHSRIGSHQILHSGYLDCAESNKELNKPFDKMKFVLTKKFNRPRVSHTFHQANTWWSLAKLAGIDTVIRAECDQSFVVKNIDEFEADSLVHEHRKIIFLASLNMFLNHFKSVVTKENKCYNFHFNGKDKKLTGYMMMDLDDDLIPFWYINEQLPLES
ncbi:decapping and exoribonuclease protein-like [Tetranychus urticae]|uniref:Decapping nuclease n=1 Tax=Tetranychus urticae TaxID=32264 RepID=T1KUE2_TETUR|nr:decapping and exoribonuclease protein-like [Tetranychus urticae]